MPKKLFLILFLVAFAFPVLSQQTLKHSSDEIEFSKGIELLNREKYAAAREFFERYVQDFTVQAEDHENRNIRSIEAEYYVAYSALQLFHPDAEQLFLNFAVKYPWHSKASLAYYELGNFFYNTKKYQKTIEYLEKVDQSRLTREQKMETAFRLGYAYFSQKEFDKALEYFNSIKNDNHKYTYAASYYAGYLELKKDQLPEALEDFQEAANNDSYKAVVPYLIASIYYKQGENEKLISYAEDALKIPGIENKEQLSLLLAEGHFQNKDYEKAAEYFEGYLGKSRKPDGETLYRIAFSQFMTNQFEKAIQNFKPIAGDKSAMGQAASYYLGLSYLKTGNKQYAMFPLQQAARLEYSPEIREEAIFSYGKANVDLGNHHEAITAFKQLFSLYPNSSHSPEATELISDAFLKTNNYQEAIDWIESLKNKSLRINSAYQKMTYFQGTQDFNNKNFEKAVLNFNKSLQVTIDKNLFLAASFWKGEAHSIMREYNEAINSYSKVFQNAQASDPFHVRSRYGIGYAYLNNDKKEDALRHFKEYVNKTSQDKENTFYHDAILRVGDLYAWFKKFDDAIAAYNTAIDQNNPEKDYAHYRKGIVYAFQNKTEQAISSYDQVIKNYPGSIYLDDALYNKAYVYYTSGNFSQAMQVINTLLKVQPGSAYVPYAILYRGLSNTNLGKHNEALEDFRKIIAEYPGQAIAVEALTAAQTTLNTIGKPEEFASYRELFTQNNPESGPLQNIDYEAALAFYHNEKYEKAISAFNNYIEKYPESPKTIDAKFYMAESYAKNGQKAKAVELYQTLASGPKTAYTNRAVQKLAEVYLAEGNLRKATDYFRFLLANAESPRERLISWSALIDTYYNLKKYDSVQYYANQILEQRAQSLEANKANLFYGKASYKLGETDKAMEYFRKTIELAQDENAAEAQYMIAKIYSDRKEYEKSQEALFELNKNFSMYPKWFAKSFLLLADNLIAMNELFQAKATLNSIIENSDYAPAVEEAKKKLAELESKEKATEIKEDSTNE